MDKNIQLSDIRFLDLFFREIAREPRIPSYCALDGFVTASLLGPCPEPVSVWYDELFGTVGPVNWENSAQENHFRNLITLTCQNVQARSRSLNTAIFKPYPCLPCPGHLEGDPAGFSGISHWCLGFSKGADRHEDSWMLASVRTNLENLIDFGRDPEGETYPVGNFLEARKWLEWEVTGILKYWKSQGVRPVDLHEGRGRVVSALGREPGRNDPCSCGSGKKYKKCCLGVKAG